MQTPTHSSQSTSLPSNWNITQLPGLSPDDQAKLINCGIKTTQQLIQQRSSPTQKQALATGLETHIQHLNKWLALADLASLPSVGCQHCGLLLHAGICSCAQLAQTPLHRLHQQILRLQVASLQRRDLCPSTSEMLVWIQQAQMLLKKTLIARK